jgi:hypothetical protein
MKIITYIVVFAIAYGLLFWQVDSYIAPIPIILTLLLINFIVSKLIDKAKERNE